MISSYFVVALGGALGSVARFAVSRLLPTTIFGIPFPILLINIFGCFVIGTLSEIMALRWSPSPNIRFFLITGILGGFTTFSSFSLEAGLLFQKQAYFSAFVYISSSVILSLLFFFAGIKIVKLFF